MTLGNVRPRVGPNGGERVSGRPAPRGLQLLDDGQLLSSQSLEVLHHPHDAETFRRARTARSTGPCTTYLAGTDRIKEAAVPRSSSFQCWAIRPRRPPLAVPPPELQPVCLIHIVNVAVNCYFLGTSGCSRIRCTSSRTLCSGSRMVSHSMNSPARDPGPFPTS